MHRLSHINILNQVTCRYKTASTKSSLVLNTVKYLIFQFLNRIHFIDLNCSSMDLTSVALKEYTTNKIFVQFGIQICINTLNSQEISSLQCPADM